MWQTSTRYDMDQCKNGPVALQRAGLANSVKQDQLLQTATTHQLHRLGLATHQTCDCSLHLCRVRDDGTLSMHDSYTRVVQAHCLDSRTI